MSFRVQPNLCSSKRTRQPTAVLAIEMEIQQSAPGLRGRLRSMINEATEKYDFDVKERVRK